MNSFLPHTLGSWAAIVAAVASAAASLLGLKNRKQISEVHVLVNDRMSRVEAELDRERESRINLAGNMAYQRGLREGQTGRGAGPRA